MMRKAFLLACASLFLGGSTAFAQDVEKSWTSGSEVGEGKFIIYNKTLEGYVDGGFDGWGTNGGIYKNPRFYNFTINGGGYNIDTEISNGGNAHFMQATTWLDGGAVAQTFEIVDAEIPTYRFGNGGKWFGGTAKNAVWTLAADAINTEWLLISEDEYKAKLKELEYDGHTYFNATALINGARSYRNFTNGIDKSGNWTITGSGSLNGGSNQYRAAEFYNTTFSMSQTIEDVPNGKYVFRVQGFQRISNNTKPTVLFANEATSPMMLRSEGTATGANSMTAAAEAMFNGDFDNNAVEVIVTDHTLTIGLKKDTKVGGDDWVIFNNFSLHYYGLDLSELKDAIQARLDVANALGKCSNTASAALSNAIANAQSALNSNDGDIMAAAQTALNNAIADAESSMTLYAAAQAAIDDADAKAKTFDAAGQAAYAANIDPIKAAYEAGTLDEANAVASVRAALVAGVTSQTTPGISMTEAIANADFEAGNLSGWTYTNAQWQNNKTYGAISRFAEKWVQGGNTLGDCSLTQTITLRKGLYALEADVIATQQNGVPEGGIVGMNLVAGTESVACSCNGGNDVKHYTLNFTLEDETAVEMGFKVTSTNGNWWAVDNFRLTYRGADEEEVVGTELVVAINEAKACDLSVSSAAVGQLLTDAIAAGEAAQNADDMKDALAALNAAIAVYNTTTDAYVAAIDFIAVCQNIKEHSTINEGQTADAFIAAIATAQADVEATTDAEATNAVITTLETARQAYVVNAYPEEGCTFDMSFMANNIDCSQAATIGWTSTASDFKLNTWSNEGNSDGSNFLTPFIESWVGSGTLAAHTTTYTATGLPKGQYTVSGLVRISNQGEGKVYLLIGNEKVEITGDPIHVGGTRKLYQPSATCLVKNGKLTFGLEVEDNATGWISFKNFKLTLNRALTDAEAVIVPEDLAMSVAEATVAREGITLTVSSDIEDAEMTVDWTSSDETIATVADGVVTPVGGNGDVIITATSIHNENVKATATIHVVNAESTMPETIEQLEGDYIVTYSLGENIIKNGSFEYANPLYGWRAGDGNSLSSGNFTSVENEGSVSLKVKAGGGDKSAGAIATSWSIEADKKYIISYNYKNYGSEYQKISLTNTVDTETSVISKAYNDKKTGNNSNWQTQQYVFTNTDGYQFVQARFRWMNNNSTELDNFYLAELTETGRVVNPAPLNDVIAIADSKYAEITAEAVAGEGVFHYSAATAAALKDAIDAAKDVTLIEVEDRDAAITALQAAIDAVALNAPVEGQAYNLINVTSGFKYAGNAITVRNDRTDAGGYNLGYTQEPNALLAQAFYFDAVESGYNIHFIDFDGNERYICTAKGGGYGDATEALRTTDDQAKALRFAVSIANNGAIYLQNTEKGNSIGSNGDAGVYTAGGSNKDFSVVPCAAVASVTMKITDAKWGTFVAPFDAALPEGVTAYTVVSVNDETGYLRVSEAEALEANKPYVVYSETEVEETLTGVSEAYNTTYTDGMLTGVYTDKQTTGGEYVLQNHDGNVGFYLVNSEAEADDKPWVRAGRAYLNYTAPAATPEAGVRLFFLFEDLATGINAAEAVNGNDVIYDLSGRRVNSALKGIYIINGKKVLK